MNSEVITAPPNHTHPQYNFANTPVISSSSPPVPHPDCSQDEARDFLRLFFAAYYSRAQDHPLVQALVNRFDAGGRDLYSASESRLMALFGEGPGEDLYRKLGNSRYGWLSKVMWTTTLLSRAIPLPQSGAFMASLGLSQEPTQRPYSPLSQLSHSSSSDSFSEGSVRPAVGLGGSSDIDTRARASRPSGGIISRRPHRRMNDEN